MVEKIDFRLVRANGSIYLRKEDVIEYLLWLAAGEETDTRNRLEEAAKKIEALGSIQPNY